MRRFGPGRGWSVAEAFITGSSRACVRRRFNAFPIALPLCDGEGDGGGGGGGGAGAGGDKDAAYYKSEAQKAFKARDELKQRLRELEEQGLVLTADQKTKYKELEDAAAKAEEDRAKKAGEFESLKKNLTDKHEKELADRETRISTLSKRFQDTVVRAEFGTATDLFGGHDGSKTVLDVDMAIAVLGRFVTAVDDEADPRGYRIVVKDSRGNEVTDAKGNPLPFSQALAEVISSLPNKDRILRGSGKAGSGARGGSGGHGTGQIDFTNLTPEQLRDPAVIEANKRRIASAGGMTMGSAWERPVRK